MCLFSFLFYNISFARENNLYFYFLSHNIIFVQLEFVPAKVLKVACHREISITVLHNIAINNHIHISAIIHHVVINVHTLNSFVILRTDSNRITAKKNQKLSQYKNSSTVLCESRL